MIPVDRENSFVFEKSFEDTKRSVMYFNVQFSVFKHLIWSPVKLKPTY